MARAKKIFPTLLLFLAVVVGCKDEMKKDLNFSSISMLSASMVVRYASNFS